MPGHRKPASQRTVRANQLDRSLEQFNAEIGEKVALLLQKYHLQYVEPRFQRLETPWYRRLWSWLRRNHVADQP